VVTRGRDLVVRGLNGGEELVVRAPEDTLLRFPTWSPDGTQIAYVQEAYSNETPRPDDGHDLYVVDVGGGAPRLVWPHDAPGAILQGIAWQPDDEALLLGYLRFTYEGSRYTGTIEQIEQLELRSGERTVLVERGLYPSVAPAVARIAYLTIDGGTEQIWTARPDGSDARLVPAASDASPLLTHYFPRLSPDGQQLAFAAPILQLPAARLPKSRTSTSARPETAAHGLPMDLWSATLADGHLRRLTTIGADDPVPAWLPDGSGLVVMTTTTLFQLSASGGALREIGEGGLGGGVDVR
jgi:Tol biopolymer transport system component